MENYAMPTFGTGSVQTRPGPLEDTYRPLDYTPSLVPMDTPILPPVPAVPEDMYRPLDFKPFNPPPMETPGLLTGYRFPPPPLSRAVGQPSTAFAATPAQPPMAPLQPMVPTWMASRLQELYPEGVPQAPPGADPVAWAQSLYAARTPSKAQQVPRVLDPNNPNAGFGSPPPGSTPVGPAAVGPPTMPVFGGPPIVGGLPNARANYQAFLARTKAALPNPNRIVPREWMALPQSTRDLLLGAYESLGWSPDDVQYITRQLLPGNVGVRRAYSGTMVPGTMPGRIYR